ncbi:MAG: non-canonical purine NTP pyrophosphatase [Patescibacteria group bacterium]
MAPIFFITGNKGKFDEAKLIVPEIEQLDIDLPEIQESDAKRIIQAKLIAARTHQNGEFIVEDTGLYLDCLNGFPGPLIKWLLAAVGPDGIYRIAENMGNCGAVAKTVIGYGKSPEDTHFFEGSVRGAIVDPRGDFGFGWDPIFKPDGHERTFAEMSREEKNTVSMRRIATEHLKSFLTKRGVQ